MKAARPFILSLVILAFVFPISAIGQRKVVLNMPTYDQDYLFHFGFVLGVNQSFASIRPIADLGTRVFDSTYLPDILPLPDSARVLSVNSTPIPGFVISIVGNMRMGKHFDLQFVPSLSFGDRTINYEIETYSTFAGKDSIQRITKTKKIPSTYINFPLEIKYKAMRYNNFRPYLLAGAQYSLDLASQAKKREQKADKDDKIVKFNQNDIYLEAGVGFDFYNEWFKFGLELKMMYGVMDVLKHENNIYTESIDKVNSKIFQVSFTFE